MPGRLHWGEGPAARKPEEGFGGFWPLPQISARARGGKGPGIKRTRVVTQSCSRITEDYTDFVQKKGK